MGGRYVPVLSFVSHVKLYKRNSFVMKSCKITTSALRVSWQLLPIVQIRMPISLSLKAMAYMELCNFIKRNRDSQLCITVLLLCGFL